MSFPKPRPVGKNFGTNERDKVIDVSKTLDRIKDESITYGRVEEIAEKKKSFIDSAVKVGGFTQGQAEWLWEHKATQGPLR